MDVTEIRLPSRQRRGRYSNNFKQQIIAACAAPGVSTAAVALANGLNANLLRRWIAEARGHEESFAGDAAVVEARGDDSPSFVRLEPPVREPSLDRSRFELQLQRGDLRITASGSSGDCAAFVRALLG